MTVCSASAEWSITTKRDPPPTVLSWQHKALHPQLQVVGEKELSKGESERSTEGILGRSVSHKCRHGGCIKTDMLTCSPPPMSFLLLPHLFNRIHTHLLGMVGAGSGCGSPYYTRSACQLQPNKACECERRHRQQFSS